MSGVSDVKPPLPVWPVRGPRRMDDERGRERRPCSEREPPRETEADEREGDTGIDAYV